MVLRVEKFIMVKKQPVEISRDNIEADVAKNRWTPNNPSNTIPRANTAALRNSTYFLESGDFFRINNLALGYTFAPSLLSKAKIQSFADFWKCTKSCNIHLVQWIFSGIAINVE